jgi:hypothetical protein
LRRPGVPERHSLNRELLCVLLAQGVQLRSR